MSAAPEPSASGPRFGRFVAGVLGIFAALLAVGYWPTRSMGGEAAVQAMLIACVSTAAASIIGALPLLLMRPGPGTPAISPALAATGIRLLVVLGITIAVVVLGQVARFPFLIWLGISYLCLLILDTVYLLGTLREPGKKP